MAYQLIASPGAGHQGIEPLTPRLEGLGACCSSCARGRPCATGDDFATDAKGVLVALGLGLAVFLAAAHLGPGRKRA